MLSAIVNLFWTYMVLLHTYAVVLFHCHLLQGQTMINYYFDSYGLPNFIKWYSRARIEN